MAVFCSPFLSEKKYSRLTLLKHVSFKAYRMIKKYAEDRGYLYYSSSTYTSRSGKTTYNRSTMGQASPPEGMKRLVVNSREDTARNDYNFSTSHSLELLHVPLDADEDAIILELFNLGISDRHQVLQMKKEKEALSKLNAIHSDFSFRYNKDHTFAYIFGSKSVTREEGIKLAQNNNAILEEERRINGEILSKFTRECEAKLPEGASMEIQGYYSPPRVLLKIESRDVFFSPEVLDWFKSRKKLTVLNELKKTYATPSIEECLELLNREVARLKDVAARKDIEKIKNAQLKKMQKSKEAEIRSANKPSHQIMANLKIYNLSYPDGMKKLSKECGISTAELWDMFKNS